MKTTHHILGVCLTLTGVSTAASGCGGGAGETGDPYLDEVFTSTHYELTENGPPRLVSVEYVTRRQQLAELAREEERAILEAAGIREDSQALGYEGQGASNCSDSTFMRLYTLTNYSGFVICFSGTGEADLNNYCYNPLNCAGSKWAYAVDSFKAGNQNGVLGSSQAYFDCEFCEDLASGGQTANCTSECNGSRWAKRGTSAVCNPC